MTVSSESENALPLWPGPAPEPDSMPTLRQPTLTPCLARTDKPRGAVIVCPGGGYRTLADHEGMPVAQRFVQAGIHGFVLKYRHAPHRHPVPMLDAQRAIRLVRHRAAEWKVDAARIAILGFSAGGHLAATVLTHHAAGQPDAPDPVERQSCRPDAAVLCYAVTSFALSPHGGSMQNLLGPEPQQALVDDLSNERHLTDRTPPTFLWHTAADPAVPVEASLLFAEALQRHRVPYALHIFPRGRHGLGLAIEQPDVAVWPDLCITWLKGLGF